MGAWETSEKNKRKNKSQLIFFCSYLDWSYVIIIIMIQSYLYRITISVIETVINIWVLCHGISRFLMKKKPEGLEETLRVRLRLTETHPSYNINFVVKVGGVIDDHYANLTSQGVQHGRFPIMVIHPVINPVKQGFTSVYRQELVLPFGAGCAS